MIFFLVQIKVCCFYWGFWSFILLALWTSWLSRLTHSSQSRALCRLPPGCRAWMASAQRWAGLRPPATSEDWLTDMSWRPTTESSRKCRRSQPCILLTEIFQVQFSFFLPYLVTKTLTSEEKNRVHVWIPKETRTRRIGNQSHGCLMSAVLLFRTYWMYDVKYATAGFLWSFILLTCPRRLGRNTFPPSFSPTWCPSTYKHT